MDDIKYKMIVEQQKNYHESLQRSGLLKEAGARETGIVYEPAKNANADIKRAMLKEIWNYYNAGARITVNGRDLMPHEYPNAAYLLATGELARDILGSPETDGCEYRLRLNQ